MDNHSYFTSVYEGGAFRSLSKEYKEFLFIRGDLISPCGC